MCKNTWTNSLTMTGQSEVACWGETRRRSTRKQRNTCAWIEGITCGKRRLSASRSIKEIKINLKSYRCVEDSINCWINEKPCISGMYLWYWSISLQSITKASLFRSCALCSYSCSFDEKMLMLLLWASETLSKIWMNWKVCTQCNGYNKFGFLLNLLTQQITESRIVMRH